MERCTSTTLTMVSLGGVVQQSLGDERMMMDSRRMVELFGVVEAPTAGFARSLR